MNPTISHIQDQIIDQFKLLDGDRESTIYYIMELGQKLDPFPEKERKDINLVKGCQSKVWLTAAPVDDTVQYEADSNTEVTKGLISLLIRILSGQKSKDITDANLYFIEKIGMSGMIGSQRSNGLLSMIKQMKLYALALGQLSSVKNQPSIE